MEKMKKLLVIFVAAVLLQVIYFGIPNQASAIPSPPTNLTIIDPSLFNISTQYTLIDPVIMDTSLILQAQQLTFENSFTGAGLVNLLSASGGVTFSDVTLEGLLLANGSVGFAGSNALGYVAPTPHPPKDEMLTALTASTTAPAPGLGLSLGTANALLNLGIQTTQSTFTFFPTGNNALGFVAPTPHPHGFDGFPWSGDAIIVDGNLNLTGVTVDVDNLVSGSWAVGDFITLFGATGGITGTPTLTGAFAQNFVYFDPTDVNGNETGGIIAVTAIVPEPSTILLLGAGLFGLAGIGVLRSRKTAAKQTESV